MRERTQIIAAFLGAAALLAFAILQPGFADPDPFYHANISLLIRDHGFIQTFPWFAYTSWASAFVDVHLLYHLLLIPFVTVFDPITGMRVSAFIFGMAALYAIWRFLKSMNAPGAHLLMLAAVMSGLFLHRLSMPRAMSLAIVCLLAVTWIILKRRPWAALICAAAFTYLYHGFPLMGLSFVSIVAANIIVERLHGAAVRQAVKTSIRQFAPTGLGLLAGIALGTIFNPYFPANLSFQWLSIVEIGVANTQTAIQAGTEWLPGNPTFLVQTTAPALAAAGLAIVLFILAVALRKTKETKELLVQTAACGILAAGYSILTLKSIRFAEYAVPFLVLVSGGLLSLSSPLLRQELLPVIHARLAAIRRHATILIPVSLAGIAFLVVGSSAAITPRTYFRADQYVFATEWVREHVAPGAMIYTNGWDYPSVLWYLDDTHTYPVGLDPRLMEDADPQTYAAWAEANTGKNDMRPILDAWQTPAAIIDLRLVHATEVVDRLQEAGCVEVGRNEWVVLLSCQTL